MVSGAHWLRTLGPILWDFTQLWMRFSIKGREYTFKGIPSADLEIVDCQQMTKNIRKHGKGMILQLYSLTGQSVVLPPEAQLKALLNEYGDISAEPRGLPPQDPMITKYY